LMREKMPQDSISGHHSGNLIMLRWFNEAIHAFPSN
jgi:hypothetical protein